MKSAAQRVHRVQFENRVVANPDAPQDFGNARAEWFPFLAVWAAYRPKFGAEQLAAGRLESTAVGTLTVLRFPGTLAVTADFRVAFLAGPYAGSVGQIRSVVPTPDNREIEFLLEIGVAT